MGVEPGLVLEVGNAVAVGAGSTVAVGVAVGRGVDSTRTVGTTDGVGVTAIGMAGTAVGVDRDSTFTVGVGAGVGPDSTVGVGATDGVAARSFPTVGTITCRSWAAGVFSASGPEVRTAMATNPAMPPTSRASAPAAIIEVASLPGFNSDLSALQVVPSFRLH